MYTLFHCSSRIYLTEMNISPEDLNHHSSNSTCFEAQKVLLHQQRTRARGPGSRVYCQSQERAQQQAQSSLSVPESAEGQSPIMMGVVELLGDTRNPMVCSWPPTALCLMHTCDHSPALPQDSSFSVGFDAEQVFSQGFVSDPHQRAHEGDLQALRRALACYSRARSWEGDFSGSHDLCWTSPCLTVCTTKITSIFWDFLEALADMPQCWDR